MKQILSLDVPTLRPRNPLVAALRMQRAGPHAASAKSRRQRAERALQHELDRLRLHPLGEGVRFGDAARQREIERRTKYGLIAQWAFERKMPIASQLNYVDWYLGKFSESLAELERDASRSTGGVIGVMFNMGGGVLGPHTTYALPGTPGPTGGSVDRGPLSVAIADLDGDGALDIAASPALGQDATNSAKAAYDALSSGIEAGKAVEFLGVAGKAATAGLTTMDSAGKALTVTLNSFNLSADQATAVSDAMFAAANVGVTTFDELAGSFGGVASIASASSASRPIGQSKPNDDGQHTDCTRVRARPRALVARSCSAAFAMRREVSQRATVED